MFHRIIWFLPIFLSVVDTEGLINNISVSGQDYVIYHFKTHHPFEQFRNHESGVTSDFEDITSALPFEIESSAILSGFRRDVFKNIESETNQRNLCDQNNGNCSQRCETVSGKAICSCNEGFSVTENGNCIPISNNEIVLSGTSGNFDVVKEHTKWIIKAPDHHVIRVVLTLLRSYNHRMDYAFSRVYVNDGNSNMNFNGDTSSATREWISTGSYLKITTGNLEYGSIGFRASFQAGTSVYISHSENAAIRIPFSTSEVCYSLTYSLPEEENEKLYASLESTRLQTPIEPNFMHSESRWNTAIFGVLNPPEGTSLNFVFPGIGAKIFSLRKCLNIENHYVGDYGVDANETKCLNGGLLDYDTETCLCPMGFTGEYCEEGCGPNSYGENCTEVCSLLSSKCEGMLFCTEKLCSCAPGLHGRNCDTTCLQGWYGASCRQQCGKCKGDKSCNIYTGKCYSGCESGYYPPLCQQTYKVFTDEPSIAEIGYTYVILSLSFQNVTGVGEPTFYQVQYKDEEDNMWSKLAPRIISSDRKYNISGLLPGKYYTVRIILLDKDGGSYQFDVPQTTFLTKCKEPEQANYQFSVQKVTAHEIELEWAYSPGKNTLECEIEKFELSFFAGDENFIVPVTQRKRITGLLPDTEYAFQLIGETVTGHRIVPSKTFARTLSAAPGEVRDVRVTPSNIGSKLLISWLPPWNSAEDHLRYKVTYECEKLIACENITCSSSGQVEVQTNSVLLEQLSPHALYEIKIAAISLDGYTAEEYTINATTAYSAPKVAPSPAENPIFAVTNSSASMKWMPPTDCTELNGYLNGYSYLLIDKETKHTLYEGTVPENMLYVSFSGLVPQHCYEANIAIAASGGADFRYVLVIPFCTTSTAPDQVQSLEVYKRGRRMVGLRWDLPLNLYGEIESFTITYSKVGKGTNKTVIIKPNHCEAWPSRYCHTLSNLSPGKKYIFVVQARNKEVSTDGQPASVEAVTAEGVSTPPRNLRIINVTENSVLLGWELPADINGQLRSFVVVTEQIDMNGDSDECCDDIPLKDYRVSSEEPLYTYEITGLAAASTYSVAIAAKTGSIGEVSRIIVHTLPPKPNLPQNALTLIRKEDCSIECDTVTLRIHPAESTSGVNRTYILLLLSNSSRSQELFDDNDVATLLHSKFGGNYQIISEYTEGEIEAETIVTFRRKDLGLENEELQSQRYALVLIQEYMGRQSVGIFIAENV